MAEFLNELAKFSAVDGFLFLQIGFGLFPCLSLFVSPFSAALTTDEEIVLEVVGQHNVDLYVVSSSGGLCVLIFFGK